MPPASAAATAAAAAKAPPALLARRPLRCLASKPSVAAEGSFGCAACAPTAAGRVCNRAPSAGACWSGKTAACAAAALALAASAGPADTGSIFDSEDCGTSGGGRGDTSGNSAAWAAAARALAASAGPVDTGGCSGGSNGCGSRKSAVCAAAARALAASAGPAETSGDSGGGGDVGGGRNGSGCDCWAAVGLGGLAGGGTFHQGLPPLLWRRVLRFCTAAVSPSVEIVRAGSAPAPVRLCSWRRRPANADKGTKPSPTSPGETDRSGLGNGGWGSFAGETDPVRWLRAPRPPQVMLPCLLGGPFAARGVPPAVRERLVGGPR
mmetsp:Transcript_6544/g.18869  ORF Transcript_6544/g.18869 Transcript_6544/m.18869 type:complete len:322 (-) Transcript_6544:860-1825(-)